MGNKLEFETSLDPGGWNNGLKTMEQAARRFHHSMNQSLPTVANSKVAELLGGGGSGSGYTPQEQGIRRSSAGFAQLLHSVRASIDSLVSGQDPMRVFLQQAPQVAQAFMQMGKGAMAFAKSILMSPITWFVAGVAALAGVVLLAVRHFDSLAEQQKNLRSLTKTTNQTIQDQMRVMEDGVKAHQEYVDWLKKHGAAEDAVAKATDRALKAMREKAAFERELAGSQGASKVRLAKMEIEASQEQLDFLKKSAAAALAEHTRLMNQLKSSESRQSQFNFGGEANKLAALNKNKADAEAVAEAIRQKMRTEPIYKGGSAMGVISDIKARPATDNDVFQVEVAGKNYALSMAQARDTLADITSQISVLAGVQKNANESVEDFKKRLDAALERYNKLNGEASDAESNLALKKQFAMRIAAYGSAGGGSSADSLVRVGNFLGTARGKIESLAEKQANLLAEWLPKIAANTGGKSGNAHYPTN